MSNTTIQTPGTGPLVIQATDFYQTASVLHPIIIGTIILALLFGYLRISSNRSVAPMTLFDSIVSIALGSTLAGVVNGTALVRGILALVVLLFWQYFTSFACTQWPQRLGYFLTSPALVVVFRGQMLEDVMRKHRISKNDLNGALRSAQVWNICEVEVRSRLRDLRWNLLVQILSLFLLRRSLPSNQRDNLRCISELSSLKIMSEIVCPCLWIAANRRQGARGVVGIRWIQSAKRERGRV